MNTLYIESLRRASLCSGLLGAIKEGGKEEKAVTAPCQLNFVVAVVVVFAVECQDGVTINRTSQGCSCCRGALRSLGSGFIATNIASISPGVRKNLGRIPNRRLPDCKSLVVLLLNLHQSNISMQYCKRFRRIPRVVAVVNLPPQSYDVC